MGEDGDNAGLMHPPDSSTRKRMALDFSDDLDVCSASILVNDLYFDKCIFVRC